jgi:uncharacterized protein
MPDPNPISSPRVVLPIFPLPDVVLFPAIQLRLHIFEPRYRQLTADVLAGERRLAIAVLLPGFESEYLGDPPVAPLLGTGRIRRSRRLADGRFLLVIQGESRGRLVRELPRGDCAYRRAEIQILPDEPTPELLPVGRELLKLMNELPGDEIHLDPATLLGEGEEAAPPHGVLAWIHALAHLAPLPVERKLALLGIDDPLVRARTLRDELARLVATQDALTRHRPLHTDFLRN